jgi:hypothetical protein
MITNFSEVPGGYQNYCDVVAWTVEDLMDAVSESPKKKIKIHIPKYQRTLVRSEVWKKLFLSSLKAVFPFGALLLFKAGTENDNVREGGRFPRAKNGRANG